MSQQTIGVGTVANDGTGDPLRTAFTKSNANFTELYGKTGASSTTASGIVELATTAETITGSDTVRAVTPAGLAGFFANGQIPFPASPNPSANANTLDDYTEYTFTITAAFATPGTSSWAYSSQLGRGTKIGRVTQVSYSFNGTPTIGTGSGVLNLTGFPYTLVGTGVLSPHNFNANWAWPASRTQLVCCLATSTLNIFGIGTAVGVTTLGASNMTTGVSHTFQATGIVEVS